MITDVVCEQLMKREKEKRDYIMITLIWLAAAMLLVALGIVVVAWPTLLAPSCILMGIAVVFLARWITKKFDVEYEYSFVNGDLTIDKITGKSKRVRLATISIRQIEDGGIADESFFASHKNVLNYSCSKRPENGVYLRARVGGDLEYVVISPDARVRKAMRPYFKPTFQRVIYKDEINAAKTTAVEE